MHLLMPAIVARKHILLVLFLASSTVFGETIRVSAFVTWFPDKALNLYPSVAHLAYLDAFDPPEFLDAWSTADSIQASKYASILGYDEFQVKETQAWGLALKHLEAWKNSSPSFISYLSYHMNNMIWLYSPDRFQIPEKQRKQKPYLKKYEPACVRIGAHHRISTYVWNRLGSYGRAGLLLFIGLNSLKYRNLLIRDHVHIGQLVAKIMFAEPLKGETFETEFIIGDTLIGQYILEGEYGHWDYHDAMRDIRSLVSLGDDFVLTYKFAEELQNVFSTMAQYLSESDPKTKKIRHILAWLFAQYHSIEFFDTHNGKMPLPIMIDTGKSLFGKYIPETGSREVYSYLDENVVEEFLVNFADGILFESASLLDARREAKAVVESAQNMRDEIASGDWVKTHNVHE